MHAHDPFGELNPICGSNEPQHKHSFGAINLIRGCLGAVARKNILLVCEDHKYGWYDEEAAESVHRQLTIEGANVTKIIVGLPTNKPNMAVKSAMQEADEVIFFARLGDQGRFNSHYSECSSIMSYALNTFML